MKVKPNCEKVSGECIFCGECEKVCPTGAIFIGNNRREIFK